MAAWYAVRVRVRSEDRVAMLLEHKEVEFFAPSWAETRIYSDRVRQTSAAAFPGYVFCRIDLAHRLLVLNTPGVQGLAGASGPEIVEEQIIENLRKAFSQAELASPLPYVNYGDRVRVLWGPMAGSEGFLVRTKGKDRLVISVDLLQRSVAVEVDASSVLPADSRRHQPSPPVLPSLAHS